MSTLLLCLALATQGGFTNPNAFLGNGPPSFVVGTRGDELSDRAVRAQVQMIRDLLFPGTEVVDDLEVDARRGAAAWPANPIVYGGPHVNAVLELLAPGLPFELGAGRLELGGRRFEGDDIRLIAVVPAAPARAGFPDHPEFLLYAGTGTPGIAEINGISHGSFPIQVADTFGTLVAATWTRGEDGALGVKFGRDARRIEWRSVVLPAFDELPADEREGLLPPRGPEVLFPAMIDADGEEDVARSCWRAFSFAARRMQLEQLPTGGRVFVYPDPRSKQSLTGKAGQGHADVEAGALHVVRFERRGFESLMHHEGAHLIGYEAWGMPGSPLLGEGLAVWVSGQYGGKLLPLWLPAWKGPLPAVELLMGAGFRQLGEQQAYPLGGHFVGAAIETVGLAPFRDHLYGASGPNWAAACARAGVQPGAIEAAWHERYRR